MPTPPNFASNLRQFIDHWEALPRPVPLEYLDDGPFDAFVWTEQVRSWRDITRWLGELQGRWCFRGHREASWRLATSMDRASTVAYRTENGEGYHHLNRQQEELKLLRVFRQQAHRHTRDVPAVNDSASWLAMMQHYGVPTRLLDWTASPLVGLYFALDDEPVGSHAALWALDLDWLDAAGRKLLPVLNSAPATTDPQGRIDWLNRLLYETNEGLIIPIDPARLSDRMSAQQGLLLFKLIDQATFSQMLMGMIMHTEVPCSPVIRKLEIAKQLRVNVLERLRRMRIDSATLFPGLAGFGKSLKVRFEIKVQRAADAAARRSRALEREYLGKRRTRKQIVTAAPR
jgi:hypothetical protein